MRRSILLICIFIFFLSSCKSITQMQVMVGTKNLDFEFIEGKVKKIVVQNIRDNRFEFIVTDKNTISDIYDILSKGKIVSEKTDLLPDYTLNFYTDQDEPISFDYIAGEINGSLGNFYSKDKIYYIADSLDKNIINNFLILRKPPKNFKDVYYNCILDILDEYCKTNENARKNKFLINLNQDTEYRRFIFSYDVKTFTDEIRKSGLNCDIFDIDDKESYDIVLNIKTTGFDEFTYECNYFFENKIDKGNKTYFLRAEYSDKSDEKWSVKIAEK